MAILQNTNKKAAGLAYKAIHSALANAKRFPNIDENNLYVSKIFADGGPVLKRFKARPMGMATTIRKRTSHLTVELDALKQKPETRIKKQAKRKQKEVIKKQKPESKKALKNTKIDKKKKKT